MEYAVLLNKKQVNNKLARFQHRLHGEGCHVSSETVLEQACQFFGAQRLSDPEVGDLEALPTMQNIKKLERLLDVGITSYLSVRYAHINPPDGYVLLTMWGVLFGLLCRCLASVSLPCQSMSAHATLPYTCTEPSKCIILYHPGLQTLTYASQSTQLDKLKQFHLHKADTCLRHMSIRCCLSMTKCCQHQADELLMIMMCMFSMHRTAPQGCQGF